MKYQMLKRLWTGSMHPLHDNLVALAGSRSGSILFIRKASN